MSDIEPSADMRMMAHTLRQMFVALINEEFTTSEALQIIGFALGASAHKQ